MAGYIGNIPTPQATQSRQSFTATASQTTFATIGYTPNYVDVYLNGVHLLDGTDYTATNGSDVVLTVGAAVSDIVEVISYETFAVLDQTFTGTTTADILTTTGAFTSLGIDDNATATAMTLDASGVVHVGGTSESGTGQVSLNGSGYVKARKNGTTGIFDRITTDGTIIDLRKDGTTVGSIGNHDASSMYIGSSDTGLRFNHVSDSLTPYNPSTGANRDAAVDLGYSSIRFKDLYLSGGVYLGGTGAANYLDDYEEGTWTPVLSDASTAGNLATISNVRGNYTKTGNQVTVHLNLNNISTGGMTGANDFYIQGLPFTPPSYVSPSLNYIGSVRMQIVSFTGDLIAFVADNTSYVLVKENKTGAASANLRVSDITSGTADISISITYETA